MALAGASSAAGEQPGAAAEPPGKTSAVLQRASEPAAAPAASVGAPLPTAAPAPHDAKGGNRVLMLMLFGRASGSPGLFGRFGQ